MPNGSQLDDGAWQSDEDTALNVREQFKFAIKAATNWHRPGKRPDIFLFATPRGGSTWVMEILASQPRIKFFDEPLNPRRENVIHSGRFPDYKFLMPDTGDPARIISFLRDLQRGGHGYMNAVPFQRNHRFFTDRCVFKIHEIEHLIYQIEAECAAQVVFLLRHPIATSISRTILPRLDLFLRSAYHDELIGSAQRSARIRMIAKHGGALQRAVISWCYENLVAFRRPGPNWLFVTYEELVLNPTRACDLLLKSLDLPNRSAMLSAFERPAVNIAMSHAETLAAMDSPDARDRRRRLVTKWQQQVTNEEVALADEILRVFDVDVYEARKHLARSHYLHFDDTTERLEDS